jgi:hypothetical protein
MMSVLDKLTEPLKKEDIEIRVGSCTSKGASFLIYKTARADTKRFNEVFGLQWKREHRIENGVFICRISVYDKDSNSWISREDVGTESNTEKTKGAFSDAFKRAGFSFGCGIELYDAPFIFIQDITEEDSTQNNFKKAYKLKNRFYTNQLTITRYEYSKTDGLLIEIQHKENGVVFSNFKKTFNHNKIVDAPNKHELKNKTIREVLISGDFTIEQGQYSKYIPLENKRFFIQKSQQTGKYRINLGTQENTDYINFEQEPTKEMIINAVKV